MNYKKILTLTLSLTLALTFSAIIPNTSKAASYNSGAVQTAQNFYKTNNTNEEVAPFTITNKGSIHWLSKEEYQEAKNGEDLDSLGAPSDEDKVINHLFHPLESPYQGSFYTESYAKNYTGDPLTVANGIKGPGTISYSKIDQKTISVTYGVDLTSAEKSAVKAGASISLQKLSSTQCTYSFHVPSGYIGWIAFVPYKHKSVGTVKTYYTGRTTTKTCNCPFRSKKWFICLWLL
ncbi:hypothetical protein QS257_19565 [Terrilactibacillus sp. S3-3]|nr:hypothetical protein QS257_19565 [Terrilactibacillus sp. S3-3]